MKMLDKIIHPRLERSASELPLQHLPAITWLYENAMYMLRFGNDRIRLNYCKGAEHVLSQVIA